MLLDCYPVRVTPPTFLPVLVRSDDPAAGPEVLREAFVGELEVAYQFAPPYEPRLLTWQGWERTGMSRAELRRAAAAALYQRLDQVAIHGQPPALMLSFDGLESSVLLAHPFWDDLAASIPGDVVVGVPARDVVIFTGTESPPGLQKVRRAVDRMFFAGGAQLLSRELLVRRQRCWEVFEPAGYAEAADPVSGSPFMSVAPRSPIPPQSPAPPMSPAPFGSPAAMPGSPLPVSAPPPVGGPWSPMGAPSSPAPVGAGAVPRHRQPAPRTTSAPMPPPEPEAPPRRTRGKRRASGRAR